MDERERKILEAATRVFLRYGVKRASMSDIATEAGVARQTLYNTYANKDDVLRGSIRMFGIDAMATVNSELSVQDEIGDKLALVLREMVMKPFTFLHSSPNAEDLINGYNDAGRDEMEATYAAFQEKLTEILRPSNAVIATHGLSADLLAEIIRRSAATFKYQARDEAHLSTLLNGLIAMAISSTQSAA